jgi:DNA mismatch endonuclease, patch repair protein
MPASNRDFWSAKLLGNVQRDRRNDVALSQLGWRVFTVWECEIHKQPVLRRLERLLRSKR